MKRLRCINSATLVWVTSTLFFTLCQVDWIHGACPPRNPNDETVTVYVPINETQYDRNYSRMDSGRHPLGFYTGIWYYNQAMPNPCIKISAPQARASMLEIKIETEPPARLCVKDQSSSNLCFGGTLADCRETPGDTVYVEILCDSQCGEADVNFWYRLVLSPPNAVDWCQDRDNMFPRDLATLPAGATLPSYTTPAPRDRTGAAADRVPSFVILIIAFVIFSCLL